MAGVGKGAVGVGLKGDVGDIVVEQKIKTWTPISNASGDATSCSFRKMCVLIFRITDVY